MREKSERATGAEKQAEQVEWAIGIVSAIVIIAIVGFLVHRGATATGGAPNLSVTTERAADFGETGQLLFSVRNDGTRAAANVIVSAGFDDGSGEMQKRSVHLDHISAGSTKTGGLYLPQDTVDFEAFVEGYADP
jgi:uncharacterized protein (TIGR02588 family)